MKNLVYVLILLAGFPVGFYLSYLAKDEIKKWRKRLFILSLISLLSAIGIAFTNFSYKFPIVMGLFFIIITFLTIIYKSY